MTHETNGHTAAAPFEYLHRVRIAQLSPDSETAETSYIDGEVALIWPYSSSTRTLSLLLADRDIRLRRSKGQVKITFNGACARNVASSKLGIGDTVRLGLEGAEWIQTGDAVSTPGKKIDWDLHYEQRVVVDVGRDGKRLAVVDFEKEDSPTRAQTSPARGKVYAVTNGVNGGFRKSATVEFSSPAFVQSKRQSAGSFIDASLDPFAEDDGFVVGKGRKRTKFARHSGSWRLLDDSSDAEVDGDGILDHAAQVTILPETLPLLPASRARVQSPEPTLSQSPVEDFASDHEPDLLPGPVTTMLPPQTAASRFQPPQIGPLAMPGSPDHEDLLGAETTPRLHPLPSPGLPLVSPLIQRSGAAMGYFPDFGPRLSELDASGEGSQENQTSVQGPLMQQHPPEIISLISPEDEVSFNFNNIETSQHLQGAAGLGSGVFQVGDNLEVADGSQLDVETFLPGSTLPTESLGVEDEDLYGTSKTLENDCPDLSGRRAPALFPAPSLSQPAGVLATKEDDEDVSYTSSPAPENWQGRLSISAVESETGAQLSPPPFPFVQGWHKDRRGGTKGKSVSSRSQSFDGASDDHVGNDESSESVISQEELVGLASIAEDAAQTEETPVSPSEQASEAGIEEDNEAAKESSVLQPEKDRVPREELAEAEDDLVPTPKAQTSTEVETADTSIQQQMHDQLLTPENTQTQQPSPIQEVEKPRIEYTMPRTPQNTQETELSSLPEPAPALNLEELIREQEMASTPQLPVHTPSAAQRSLQRTRKPLPSESISHSSSPYFTPRRSSRMQSSQLPSSPIRKENIPPMHIAQVTLPTKHQPAPPTPQTNGFVKDKPRRPSAVARTFGLSTPSSYYPPLATVSEFFSTSIDVLAICTTTASEPLQAKGGPRDYQCTLQLTDPSLSYDSVVVAQIFRPFKTALPSVARGSVILLRNMKVQSQKQKCMLLSTGVSSWAVFGHPEHAYTKTNLLPVTVAGPPVEYGPSERLGAIELMQWWDVDGLELHPMANGKSNKMSNSSEEGGLKESIEYVPMIKPVIPEANAAPTSPRRSRRLANYTDHLGNGDDDDEEDVSVPTKSSGRRQSDASLLSPKSSARRTGKNRRSEGLPVHELRDGTKYVDDKSEATRRRARRSGSTVHELRDGRTWVDE